jgi:hypothetical protein
LGRLVGDERQGRLLPFAVAEAEGDLNAASQWIGGFGRRRVLVRTDGQPATMEHLRQPVSYPRGELGHLVQRGGRRAFKA